MITVVGTGDGAPLSRARGRAWPARRWWSAARRHLATAAAAGRGRAGVLGPLAPALDAVERAGEPGVGRRGAGHRGPRLLRHRPAAARARAPTRLAVLPGALAWPPLFARLGLPWDDVAVVSAHGRDLRTARERLPGAAGGRRADRAGRRAGGDRAPRWDGWPRTPGRRRGPRWAGERLGGHAGRGGRRDWGPAHRRAVPATTDAVPARGWHAGAGRRRGRRLGAGRARSRTAPRWSPSPRSGRSRWPGSGRAPGELVWDVGAGSGSVAVECARFGAAALAVERTARRRRSGSRPTPPRTASTSGSSRGGARRRWPGSPSRTPCSSAAGARGAAIVAACARRARRAVVVALAALDRVPAARAALRRGRVRVDGVQLQRRGWRRCRGT